MLKNSITPEGFSHIKTNYLYTLKNFLSPFGIDSSKLSTHSRQSVLNEVGRYCDFDKVKNKYRVLYIYPEPKPPIRKTRKDSFYPDHIQPLLPSGISIMTRKRLWEKLGMINHKYIPQYNKHDPAYDYFFNKTYERFSQILTSVLNKLNIEYNTEYMISYSNTDERLAEDKDLRIITDVQNKAMEELQCASINEIYRNHMDKKYYARCNQMYRAIFNCKYVYEVLRLNNTWDRYSGKRQLKRELNQRCYEWAAQIDPTLAKKYILTCNN